VGVGGDQRDTGQAAGDQVAEEGQPAGAVFTGSEVQAEDLPGSVGVLPVACRAWTLTTRPTSRTLSTNVSAATKV
jgi:hypothetical protein